METIAETDLTPRTNDPSPMGTEGGGTKSPEAVEKENREFSATVREIAALVGDAWSGAGGFDKELRRLLKDFAPAEILAVVKGKTERGESLRLDPPNAGRARPPSYSTASNYDTDVQWEWDKLASALEYLDPDCAEPEWWKIGAAVYAAGVELGDTERAKDLFDAWSAKGAKYDARAVNTKWNHYKPDGGINAGTLYRMAKEQGWTSPPRPTPPRPEQPPPPGDADAPPGGGKRPVCSDLEPPDPNDLSPGTAGTAGEAAKIGLKISSMREVGKHHQPVKWLLAPFIQKGKGTMVQGLPGVGKTVFICALAAHVSTGNKLLGLEVQTPGNVVIFSVEDDKDILWERLDANGADPDHVFIAEGAELLNFKSSAIEQTIVDCDARLVIFDPFQAFLGEKVDMHRANETRPVLAQLFAMCAAHDCACVIVSHLAKNQKDKSPVYASLGSADIPASMRSIWHLMPDPDHYGEVVAVHTKASNSAPGPTLRFAIGDRGGLQWCGFSPITNEDIGRIRTETRPVPYERDPLVELVEHLAKVQIQDGYHWDYDAIKSEANAIMDGCPFNTGRDLTKQLTQLSRQLQDKSLLRVKCGERSTGGKRGIRIYHLKPAKEPSPSDAIMDALEPPTPPQETVKGF